MRFIFLTLLLLQIPFPLLFGQDKSTNTPPIALDTLLFNPLELGDDGILIPRPKGSEADLDSLSAISLDSSDSSLWEEQLKLGFRVQIIATDNMALARNAEQKAQTQFNEKVYLIYDQPNFKIRVGNCSTREEAEFLRKKAVSLGYVDSWVVKDNVSVKVRKK
jgi:hypothetical protein